MPRNLIIVESPTKAKVIKKFLTSSYGVTASMGHLRDLPKSQLGVDIEHDFAPKYINIRGKGDLIAEIREKAKAASKIYLATDPDREGEAIAWHLAHILKINPNEACRIEFHEITPAAVKEAIKHPQQINIQKVDAQQARRILDRLVGYKLSPLLWRKVRKGLSAGRVQSVAVKMICDRQKEIDEFVPKEYWSIEVELSPDGKTQKFLAPVQKYQGQKLEITTGEVAQQILAALKAQHYSVSNSTLKDRLRRPYPPFTTSTLQQEAGHKLNFTTKKTMMLAQQLYEGVSLGAAGSSGLITYMRTDSVRLSDTAVAEIRSYIGANYGEQYVPARPQVYATAKNAQDAHEAIRPTSVLRTPNEVKEFLTVDQYKLYALIWQRAVACQMANAIIAQTALDIAAGPYGLRATGSTVKFDGFLHLSTKKELESEKTPQVPYLAKGTALTAVQFPAPVQHFTEPPANFTEATLVKEMEDKGIGRPSTYSPTIQTILSRGYVAKEGKKILPTELGVETNKFLTAYFPDLIAIPFSANLEKQLDDVAEEGVDKNKVLGDFYGPFAKVLEEADAANPAPLPKEVEVSDVVCEKCGRLMVYREGPFGRFLACPGFPECRNTKPIFAPIGIKCPVCHEGDVTERKTKTMRVFYGCTNYPKCSYVSWDKPLESKCPLCGSYEVLHKDIRGRESVHCSNEQCERCVPQSKAKRVAKAQSTTTSSASTKSKATTPRKATSKKVKP